MILIVDNYDSFVHNLARYVREAGFETTVLRNDAMSAAEMLALAPQAMVISPGPHAPRDAGVSMELIARAPEDLPLLGVCLGHQCLIEAFGGEIRRAKEPLHGEASAIRHDGEGVFQGLASPLQAGRYHSLTGILGASRELVGCAWSAAGELMAVRRRSAPWHGVQFHPESVLTPEGRALLGNFLKLVKAERA
ncbi:MAG TPA: aminodeoxychorismate/anthranilate synthase component II [Parvularcula sp.]|nr:aminodeoxychorismate/anthranilate synthase component II [Parvularcula sp.]